VATGGVSWAYESDAQGDFSHTLASDGTRVFAVNCTSVQAVSATTGAAAWRHSRSGISRLTVR
jgi:hypothetical protein